MLRQSALAFAIGCAGCTFLPEPFSAPKRYYVQIAEGISSPTLTESIQVRAFTAFQLVAACRTAVPVARLRVAPASLDLVQGNQYALSSLSVVAVNDADLAVPDVPLVLEAEEATPPVVQVRSDDPDLGLGRLRAVGTGRFRVRIRTMCGLPQAEAVLRGVVRP